VAGVVRLGHPFPSVLDGVVVAATAWIAGGDPLIALRLGASMTALQVSIGALNDVVDARIDAVAKPSKPIPSGLVSPDVARMVAFAAAAVGVGLAVPSGAGLVGLALAVLAIGYAYDLRAKGTAWSWVPFALGIPLLPAYGWYGAAGGLPDWFVVLLPMAVLAGAAIAMANARADLERDRATGTASVATALGAERSWWAGLCAWVLVGLLALVSAIGADGPPVATLGVAAGLAVIAAGLGLGRSGAAGRRQRSWEAQAVGAAISAVAWVAAVV
jgi:4-hydroxybenzoate polyprenyltransferase